MVTQQLQAPTTDRLCRSLSGAPLDWAFALAVGLPVAILPPHYGTGPRVFVTVGATARRQLRFSPTTNWEQAGEYISMFGFNFKVVDGLVEASAPGLHGCGPDHLTALCRAMVAGHFGDKVGIPTGLLE